MNKKAATILKTWEWPRLPTKKGYGVGKYEDGYKPAHFGIEVEVEQVDCLRDVPLSHWTCKEDGSLRNYGKEFVSRALKEHQLDGALADLKTFLSNFDYDFSMRTSIHVHLNVRDLTHDQLRSLLLLYVFFEPVLYAFVGGNRSMNNFCYPVNTSQHTYNLNRYLRNGDDDALLILSSNWSKYTGLNLKTIRQFGTIEFRHMTGTDDFEKVKSWCMIIKDLRNYAMSAEYADIKDMLIGMSTTSEYEGLTDNLFRGKIRLSNLERLLEESCGFLKDTLNFHNSFFITSKPSFRSDFAKDLLVAKGYYRKRETFKPTNIVESLQNARANTTDKDIIAELDAIIALQEGE